MTSRLPKKMSLLSHCIERIERIEPNAKIRRTETDQDRRRCLGISDATFLNLTKQSLLLLAGGFFFLADISANMF